MIIGFIMFIEFDLNSIHWSRIHHSFWLYRCLIWAEDKKTQKISAIDSFVFPWLAFDLPPGVDIDVLAAARSFWRKKTDDIKWKTSVSSAHSSGIIDDIDMMNTNEKWIIHNTKTFQNLDETKSMLAYSRHLAIMFHELDNLVAQFSLMHWMFLYRVEIHRDVVPWDRDLSTWEILFDVQHYSLVVYMLNLSSHIFHAFAHVMELNYSSQLFEYFYYRPRTQSIKWKISLSQIINQSSKNTRTRAEESQLRTCPS